MSDLVERLTTASKPSEFRRRNPTLSDMSLAMRYTFDGALLQEAAAELSRLTRENEALRDAVKPFGAIWIAEQFPDGMPADFALPVKVGDLRRLATAAKEG